MRLRILLRSRRAWAGALGAATLLAGCQNQAPPTPNPVLTEAATVPVPPVAPLYAAVTVTLPQAVIARAPVLSPPPSPDQVTRLAVAAAAPPPAPPPGGPARCGLVVCEPVAAGSAAPLAAFGAGCGRWLHLAAAGQPMLGCTPLWNSLARAEVELGRPDLRLTPPQAAGLVSTLGVTHVATGQIAGTAARCTLTYRLWRVPQRVSVGPPLTLTGSEAQVVAGLPGLARALDARLGVTHPAVPASAALTPTELGTLGGMALFPDLTDPQLGALAALAARSPLAGMALLNTPATYDQGVLDRAVAALLRQGPGNSLVVAQIADTATASLRPYAAAVGALIRRYPQSYLLAHADRLTQAVWGTRAGEWRAAQRGVADAPVSPAAWQVRGLVLATIAQDLRQGRTADKITPQEWASLTATYARWESATRQATRLDPRYRAAWFQLAQAATFAGDDAQARSALRTGLKLDPNSSESLFWGLEMFQPKWLGDQKALDAIARRAAAAHYGSVAVAGGMVQELCAAGYPALGASLLARTVAQARADVGRLPGSGVAHWQLAAALLASRGTPALAESVREYQAAVSLLPNCSSLHDAYGEALDKRGRTREAVAQFRRAVALDPFSAKADWDLGWDLKQMGQLAPAKAALCRSIHLDPTDGSVYKALGYVLCGLKEWPAAASVFAVASHLDPDDPEVLTNYGNALDGAHRYTESIAVSREAIALYPRDGYAYDVIAEDDVYTHSWQASIAASQKALQVDPNDAFAHEVLGRAYIGEGRKSEARAEWQKVLTLDGGPEAAAARKMLQLHS